MEPGPPPPTDTEAWEVRAPDLLTKAVMRAVARMAAIDRGLAVRVLRDEANRFEAACPPIHSGPAS